MKKLLILLFFICIFTSLFTSCGKKVLTTNERIIKVYKSKNK